MIKFLSIILVTLTTLSAQIILINNKNIEDILSENSNINVISYIDQNNALIINETPLLKSFKNFTIIESEWNNDFKYYVLFKRGNSIFSELPSTIGKTLYDSHKFSIIKTDSPNIRDYDQILPYDLIQIFNRPVLRNVSRTKNLNTYRQSYSEKVNNFVQKANVDSAWQMIRVLQEKERYTYSSGSNNTANFFSEYFNRLNTDTVYQDRYLSSGAPNVIAQINGTKNPEKIIIICSHYDVTRSGYPGADDNGSGTSGNLEIARVLSEGQFENSIRFVLFSGEENGLLGSENYAQKVSSKSEDILGVFNLDMISYLKPGNQLNLDVCYDNQSSQLYELYVTTAYEYLPDLSICDSKDSPWKNSSDHKSFWDKYYSALYFGDDLDPAGPDHPNYHTLADTVGNGANSKEYLEGVIKSVTATVATLAIPNLNTKIDLLKNSKLKSSIKASINNKILTIKSMSKDLSLTIFSLKGQALYTKQINGNATINLSDHPKGTYLLKIKTANSKIEKLITF